jgi:hypothetical protein
MTTPSDIADKFAMVDTIAQLQGTMSQLATGDPYAYTTLQKSAPTGKAEFGDVYPVGEMETAIPGKKADVNGLEAETITIKTVPRRWTGGIDFETWMQGDARTGGAVSRAIQLSANQIIVDRRKRLAGLLNQGETMTDIFDTTAAGGTKSAAFRGGTLANILAGTADAKFIPQSGKSFSNLVTGAYTGSAAEVRAGIFDAILLMDIMENSIGGYVHVPPENGARFRVLCSPAMRQFVHDAINEGPGAGTIGLRAMNVDYMVDAALTHGVPGTNDTAFYVTRLDQVYPALVEARRGPEEFRTSMGDLSLILFNQGLFQPYYAFGYGYGSTFNMVKVKHAV